MKHQSLDIRYILEDWDYLPDEVTVRIITGDDNREKVQMRLALGVLQMELTGRPDGKHPHSYESLLEYYEAQRQDHIRKYGDDEGFFLDPDDCEAMINEATQYYYRYLSLFHLKRYREVERDTARNLKAFDFLNNYAEDEEDQLALEQYRPYVLMMHARSAAHIALEEGNITHALHCIDDGIVRIEAFFKDFERRELTEKCGEVLFLREFREEILERWKSDPLFELREKLKQAVEQEDYETAAQLRDAIKRQQNQ